MKKMVLATSNPGKVSEFQKIFSVLDMEIIPQSAFAIEEAEETGLSFIENAIIKARHAAKLTGLPALADDSGLTVDAMQGAPGIYSARWAGEAGDARKNIQKLLADLETVPDDRRQASFYCVLALMRHALDPIPLICQGKWSGSILRSPCGSNGFGYDPIFYVPEEQLSAAQLRPDRKNQISHRGQALQALRTSLML